MTPISILLKATILIAAAALTHTLLGRRMSAAARHLMWTFVVVGLLLLPALALVAPSWTAFTTTAPEIRPATSAAVQKPANPVNDPVAFPAPFSTRPEQSKTPAVSAQLPWTSLLAVLYAAGVFLLFVRLFVERMSIQRLVQCATEVNDSDWTHLLNECAETMNVARPVRLLRSREETMPMAVGIRRRTMVIPAIADTWSEDRRRAVLLHEMAHLVRHDCLTQMLAAIAGVFYWMHPGVWWIARRLRVERELACDDRVLSAGENASDYAGHLLELAYALRGGRRPALAVCMAGPGQLEGRMIALLDAARNRAVPALRSHLTGFIILLVLLIPLAAATIAVRQGGTSELSQRPGSQPGIADQTREVVPVPDPNIPGTWEIRPTSQPRIVQLQIREGRNHHSTTIDLDHLNGLPAGFPNTDGPMQLSLQRDAGTFSVEGIIRSGIGAGTYTFAASPTFAGELAKRGLGQPTPGQQRMLAGADIGFAFLDELAAQGYVRPANLDELIRAAYHGVSLTYLREMGKLGYHFANLNALIDLRNHGVSPEYIRELAAQGLPGLTLDDLLRARSSGIDPEYIQGLREAGYGKLSLDTLVQLRAHGVDPEYARDLATLGYPKLSLDALIQLRNHGVDPEYVRDLGALGYQNLSLEELIELRNHGVDPEYARELGRLGYQKLSLNTLVELRNHGVDPEYVGDIQKLGYAQLKIDDFVRMRSSGIGPDEIRNANARAGKRLSVDNLVSLASRGWR